jgi:two-component system, NtrC family, nitrogen regulation response regulator NtrX
MEAAQREATHHHIVIVEDDADVRALMTDVLTEEGYTVTSYPQASNDVFAALLARPPALLICDVYVRAPMTGADLLRLVTTDARTRRIPIILCSAMRGHDSLADSFDGRSVRLLEKPFDLDDFLGLVTGVLYQEDGPTV